MYDCATLNLHSLRAAPLLSTELWPRATLDIVGSTHGSFLPSIGFLGSLSLSPKCIFGLSSFSMQSCEGHIGLVQPFLQLGRRLPRGHHICQEDAHACHRDAQACRGDAHTHRPVSRPPCMQG